MERSEQKQDKKAESEHIQNLELLETVLNNTASSIMLLKPVRNKDNTIIDFEYLFTNTQTLKSVNRETLTGKFFTQEFPGTRDSELLRAYVQVMDTGISYQAEADITPYGPPAWAQIYARKIDDLLLVTYFDITERKKAELEIKQSKELLQTVFDASLNPIAYHKAVRNKDGDMERVRAEEALRESEIRSQVTMDTAIDYAIINMNEEGIVQNWSRGAEYAFGRTEAEMLGKSADVIFTPEDRAAGAPDAERATAIREGSAPDERWHIRKNGTRFYMSGVMRPIYDKGTLRGFVKVARDLTEQQKIQETLRESENTLATELANMNILQAISSKLINAEEKNSGIYHEILIAAAQLMHADIVSMQMYYPATNKLKLLAYIGFAEESAKFWEWVDAASGSTCGVALQKHERIHVTNVEQCDFMKDTEDLVSYRLSGIVAVQSTPLIARNGSIVGMISTHWKKEYQPDEHEFRLLDILARMAADLLDRRHAEQVLKESEAQLKELVKQKDDFISIAGHELKTPVTSLKVYADILQEQLQEIVDRPYTALLARLNSQVNRLTQLINDLLDTTKISEGQMKLSLSSVNIPELLRERTGELQSTTNHTIILDICPPIYITADRERIGQVITNLLSNAIKFSPDNTHITITCKDTGRDIQVRVHDEGRGISHEEQQRIFDRFYRVTSDNMGTYPGMGLGLFISAQIIKRHNGAISVQSEPGHGTVFQFTLPK